MSRDAPVFSTLKTWPAALGQHLLDTFGEPASLELLRGKSGATVHRLRFRQHSVIVKQTDNHNEAHFYERIAPVLRQRRVTVPAVVMLVRQDVTNWLVLEDIPHPLPAGYRHADANLPGVLARLHSLPLTILPPAFSRYVPEWSDHLTDRALACFDNSLAVQFRPLLDELRQQAQHLFRHEAIISGDPNPTNWGLRHDGTPVLFDWERITRAAPPVDLAITVAGLGTPQQFADTARQYLIEREKINQPYPSSVSQLTLSIMLAKIWSVIEYLSFYTDAKLEPDATLEFVTSRFPSWLSSLEFS